MEPDELKSASLASRCASVCFFVFLCLGWISGLVTFIVCVVAAFVSQDSSLWKTTYAISGVIIVSFAVITAATVFGALCNRRLRIVWFWFPWWVSETKCVCRRSGYEELEA